MAGSDAFSAVMGADSAMDAENSADGGRVSNVFFRCSCNMSQEGCDQDGRKGNTNSNHQT